MFHRLRGHVHSKASRLILQQFVESRCRMYPKVINEFYWKGNKAVSLTYIDISLFLQILSLFLEILYYRYQYWVLKKNGNFKVSYYKLFTTYKLLVLRLPKTRKQQNEDFLMHVKILWRRWKINAFL